MGPFEYIVLTFVGFVFGFHQGDTRRPIKCIVAGGPLDDRNNRNKN